MNKFAKLNKNRQFMYIYNRGISLVSPLLVTYLLKNRFKNNRLGITASKKVGNAVKRNRAKRIINAAYKNIYANFNLKNGYDIVFVARAKTAKSNSNKIYNIIYKHLSDLNIINTSSMQKEKLKLKEIKSGKELK